MAQAQAAYLFWLGRMTEWATLEARYEEETRQAGRWLPPRVRDAEARDQAAQMVDRFNKVFLRSLRALRDLRRYATPVIVQNAGQVNVAAQQINVASA